MPGFTTPAIMLRRIDYGDYDLIITFLTLENGKMAAIAKSAKKSIKRFRGILEPFSVLNIVCSKGKKSGLPVLQEAALSHPFANIRMDIRKTGYASYWAEIINLWMEENHQQAEVFHLFKYVLERLDETHAKGEDLSILFQMQFVNHIGMGPNLVDCSSCKSRIEDLHQTGFYFDLKRGGLICNKCRTSRGRGLTLSRGTVKQLLWTQNKDMLKAARIKFTSATRPEGLRFVETFVPYHLGKEPKSLRVLKQVRG